MATNLRKIAVVAGSTLSSRVLGLVRDVLIFAILGAGRVNDAFVLAFTFPNLFRRLLGEGAMTSALVPVLARETGGRSRTSFFSLLDQVFARLLPTLIGLMFLFALVFGAVFLMPEDWVGPKWHLASGLGIVLVPYLGLICAAAVVAAALQVLDRFALAALSPVLLNLAMITALGGFGFWLAETAETRVLFLCIGVLVGGVLQLGIPALGLRREGWRPSPMAWRIRKDDRVREIYALLLPGIGGAAILQVNILVSRVFAFQAAADGASLVYLANRLMELPLGVFTISVTTVVFPALSKLAAVGDGSGFREQFLQGFRLILAIMLPAAIGLALLAEPVVRLLFEWGAFDATDTLKAAPLVIIYASGLPFYALATLLVRGFHARGDMKTPLRVSAWNLGINVVASLGLVGPLGVEGLALANVLAAAIQCSLLGFRLWPSVSPPRRAWVRELSELLKIQAGCVLLIAAVGAGWLGLDSVLRSGWAGGGAGVMDTVDPKWLAGLRTGVLVPLGAAVYLLSLWLLRFRDFGKMLRPVRIKQGA